jgi:shikimate dehydrogenase
VRRAAVLGSPIEHSLSPVLHRAAYADLGLDWRYDAIECDQARLPALLDSLDDSFVGLSLTMPLKRAAVPLLDDVSALATAVGAVNTVLFDGVGPFLRRRGDNTDVAGLVAAIRQLREAGVASAVILGAGGTAAAATAACRELGLDHVTVVVRDPARATELLAAAGRLGVRLDVVEWPAIAALRAAELVVSTVPAGATDSLFASGFGDAAAEGGPAGEAPLRAGQLLFDVLYHPWPTRLAAAATAAGADVIGGLELLVQQAALQVELMTGRVAPVGAMRAAAHAALG